MSRVIRRTAAPLLVSAVLAGMLASGPVTQGATPAPTATPYPPSPEPRPDPVGPPAPTPTPYKVRTLTPAPTDDGMGGGWMATDPSDSARCGLWSEERVPDASRSRLAMAAGAFVAAVDVDPEAPSCALPRREVRSLGTSLGDRILELDREAGLLQMPDGVDDWWYLFGRQPTGTPDPALDSTGVSYGTFHLNRDDVRSFRRFLEGDEFGDDVRATFGRPPDTWVERGDYTIVAFDTASDPTAPSDGARTWQVAAEAAAAGKSLPTTTGDFGPLQGARHLFTYMQLPQDGGTRRFAGHSDFGSSKAGPDGSQYYNAAGDLVVFETPQGIVFVFPGKQAPGGIRPMSYSSDTGAWDIVSGPGAATSFLPAGGAWPGVIDFAGLGVQHDPVSLPVTIDGSPSEGAVDFPSGVPLVFGSSVLDPVLPVLVDLDYTFDGHQVAFDDIPAESLGSGWYHAPIGLIGYGDYQITDAGISQPGRELPAGWRLYEELARQIGAGRFTVDESEGPLGGAATVEEFFGTAPGRYPGHDFEEIRQALAQAGWLEDGGEQ